MKGSIPTIMKIYCKSKKIKDTNRKTPAFLSIKIIDFLGVPNFPESFAPKIEIPKIKTSISEMTAIVSLIKERQARAKRKTR